MHPWRNRYRAKYFSTSVLEAFTSNNTQGLNVACQLWKASSQRNRNQTVGQSMCRSNWQISKGGGKKFQIVSKGDEKNFKMTSTSGKSE